MCKTSLKTPVHEPPMVRAPLEKPVQNSSKPDHTKTFYLWATVMFIFILTAFAVCTAVITIEIKQNRNRIMKKNPFVVTKSLLRTLNITESSLKATDTSLDTPGTSSSVIEEGLISRSQWAANIPRSIFSKVENPVKYVVICHTAGQFCESSAKCKLVVKLIQTYHMKTLKLGDIKYNFLIGGDGNVYEGLGWDFQNSNLENSINIAYIGNYVYDSLNEKMIEGTQNFLLRGVESGNLDENYLLLGHNQTMTTLSPGTQVYRIIKRWPHFSPQLVSH